MQLVWTSGEGLPQYITISLEEVEYGYSCITMVGFFCWHDYQTNPQTILMEVSEELEE